MKFNIVGAFIRNKPFGTEIAYAKGLEREGHEVQTIDPGYPDQKFLQDADATIVFKWLDPGTPYWREAKRIPGMKILYQPDDARFPHIHQMMNGMRGLCDYAFMFDDSGAEMAVKKFGYKAAAKLLLTADDELYKPYRDNRNWEGVPVTGNALLHRPIYKAVYPVRKLYDVGFIGSFSFGPNHAGRRRMCETLQRAGFDVAVVHDVFDVELLCKFVSETKILLNHATDTGANPFGHGFGYQCRHFEMGMAYSCLLSNVVDNDTVLKGFETFGSEAELVEKVHQLLLNDQERERLAEELYQDIRANHLPQHRARDIVRFVEANR
ncbi:MAG: glycosyltransferase family protein [Acidiferrobacterales bacterium]